MGEAREVITRTIWKRNHPGLDYDQWYDGCCHHLADSILSALKEAGYVVVKYDDVEEAEEAPHPYPEVGTDELLG